MVKDALRSPARDRSDEAGPERPLSDPATLPGRPPRPPLYTLYRLRSGVGQGLGATATPTVTAAAAEPDGANDDGTETEAEAPRSDALLEPLHAERLDAEREPVHPAHFRLNHMSGRVHSSSSW